MIRRIHVSLPKFTAGFVLLFILAGGLFSAGFQLFAAGQTDVEQAEESPLRNVAAVETAGVEQLQNSFNLVVQQVLPAVVQINVTQTIIQQVPQFGRLPWFFGTPEEQEYESESLGSGVIFRREGDTYYVLTNDHVAGEADRIEVLLNDERVYPAELVGTDSRRDIAVVSFSTEDRDIHLAPIGISADLKVGDWVLAMGSPFGFYSSVTAGIVSALGRSGREINNLNDFIQTDASINQGNSGGPLVNIYGEVIGINTWIAAPSGGNIGLGFAIPIDNAKQIVEEILEFGRVRDGWLGVSMIDTFEFDPFFEDLNLKGEKGVFVANIYLNSPAYKGGIRPGDLITRFDGREVNDTEELSRFISNAAIDEPLPITVNRRGSEVELTVILEERMSEEEISSTSDLMWPGVIVQPIDSSTRESLGLSVRDRGVVLMFMGGISTKNPFYSAGLRNYDVITEIDSTAIRGVADFYGALEKNIMRSYQVTFIRNGQTQTVYVERQVL
jgi:serine protease Do